MLARRIQQHRAARESGGDAPRTKTVEARRNRTPAGGGIRHEDKKTMRLRAFYNAIVALGVQDQVTLFTLSDFSRTLRVNDGGSDHAWGNHHVILGGAVRGGQTYGTFPSLALGGPDDTDSDGRWIPTTAVDQYAATLAKWFGVPDADIPAVVPNIARFASRDLGFMG
jgi:uncharacterized protein (DUF1501 family)